MNGDQSAIADPNQASRRLGQLSPTRRDLLQQVIGRNAVDPARVPIRPRDPATALLPLSRAQQAMWVVSQMTRGGVYNLPAAVRLRGPIEVGALRAAIDRIIARHEVLRTTFVGLGDPGGQPVQRVHPPAPVEVPLIDCAEAAIGARAAALSRRDFDLAAGPLFRFALFRVAPDDHVLLSVWHHLVWDGWSIGVFTTELAALYGALRQGAPPAPASPLAPLPLQFADVALWERAWLTDTVLAERAGWWVERLAAHRPAELPGDRPRPALQNFAGAMHFIDWPAERVGRLNRFGAEAGATLYMTLLAAFAVLLARWSGQPRLTIGTPAANRERPELAGLIGFFANILPLPVDCSGEPSFCELVGRVRALTAAAFARQDVPFEAIVERSGVARDPSRNPLFGVMFALHAESLDDLRLAGLSLTPFPLDQGTTHFDLGLHLWRRGDRIGGYLSYASALFEPLTIARLAGQLAVLVDDALARPDAPVGSLELLDPQERDWLGARGRAAPPRIDPDEPRVSGRYPTGTEGYRYHPPEVDRDAAVDGHPLLPVAVVDPHGRLQPIGVPGRVRVDGRATRDLGRWRADGTLEVIGPLDRTDWLGGERVYLAEVEDRLRALPGVADAHLAVRADRGWTAWVVATGPLDPARVEQCLAGYPTAVTAVLVDRLPRDPDGRVDRAALERVEVIDGRLAARWQAALAAVDGVTEARVLARPREHATALLHRARLFDQPTSPPGPAPDAVDPHPAAPDPPTPAEAMAAFADGGPLRLPADAPRTLTDALLRVAGGPLGRERGLTLVEGWSESGPITRTLCYAELVDSARRVLGGLRAAGLRPGDRALLQLGTLADHFRCFWGCLFGGIIPVCVANPPVYDRKGSVLNKLFNSWRALDRPPILTQHRALADLRTAAGLYAAEPRLLTAEALLTGERGAELHRPRPDEVVFLQLTSGSTGTPKCIQLTHDGIVHHIHGSMQACGYGPEDVTVNWLPMDHVVPILTFHLKDAYLGIRQVHAPTELILADPLRWLDLLQGCRATHSWAPNFGFALVNQALAGAGERRWDLKRMRYFMNAGEQVTLPVCSAFVRGLAAFGVRPQALQPAFGMAEACTCMTYANDFTPETGASSPADGVPADQSTDRPNDRPRPRFVDLGPPIPGVQIRIADRAGTTLPERRVGRLQIRGPVVTPGYLDNQRANTEAFPGDGWLDSGDLGFLQHGRLTLTGRAKEMIVLRGANFYCYEIEALVNQDPGVRPTFAAACAVEGPIGGAVDGSEGLAVFFVPAETIDEPARLVLVRRIGEALTREFGVRPVALLPLTVDEFPKTTSGKIQRTLLRDRLAAGDFDRRRQALDLALGNPGTVPDWFFGERWVVSRVEGAVRRPERVALLGRGDDTKRVEPDERVLDPLPLEPVPLDQAELVVDLRPLQRNDPAELLGLLQRLGALDRALGLLVVATGAMPVAPGEPGARAWLRGLLHSAAQEWPKLRPRLVDVGDGVAVTEVLQIELAAREPEVVWRRRADGAAERRAPRLQRLRWDRPQSGPFAPGQALLVTGGLGGVGVEVCRLLLAEYGCSLLLVGRSDLGCDRAEPVPTGDGLGQGHSAAERRAALAGLRRLGEVLYQVADVADPDAMAAAIGAAERQFGRPLAGALHLAGAFPARLLAEEAPVTLARALRPKLAGARVLDRLLAADAFLVLAGSVYGSFGGVAAGAYSAACSGLQGLAAERRGRGGPTWCLAFSNWDEVGMSRGYAYRERSQALGFRMLERGRALLSLRAALTRSEPFVLVGLDDARPNVRRRLTGPPEPALTLVGAYTGSGDISQLEVPDPFGRPSRCELRRVDRLDGAAGADLAGLGTAGPLLPRNQMERTVAACWRAVLGLDAVDIDRTFFELGGQSLQLVQAVARLQTTLGRDIPVVEMFRYPTVRTLARHLAAADTPPKRDFQDAAARAVKQRQAMRRRPRPARRRPENG